MSQTTKKSVGPIRDKVENFHGNQLVYIDWDYHRFLCSAMAFPFPPDMPFGALIAEVIPSIWSVHPDFKSIDWDKVEWTLDDARFTPDPEKSLIDNGIGHKSMLQFATPGLNGVGGSGN